MYKTESEKQDGFLSKLGRKKADDLQRLWDNSYPSYCSIPYGKGYPKNHTKEEVFIESAKQCGFNIKEINMFLEL